MGTSFRTEVTEGPRRRTWQAGLLMEFMEKRMGGLDGRGSTSLGGVPDLTVYPEDLFWLVDEAIRRNDRSRRSKAAADRARDSRKEYEAGKA